MRDRDDDVAPRRALSLVNLRDVRPSSVVWLWPGRFCRGKVTMLCGDPGLGKSFVTMDLAARVTARADWPDAPTPLRQPGSALILSAEDDAADTIRPRIEAAGGDVNRVLVCDGVRRAGGRTGGLCLDVDVGAIAQTIAQMERPRLLVIDPISAYMGEADSNNNAEVRGVLAELARLAMRTGVAIVCVTHLNKSGQAKAVYRQMGSLAFTAAARMVWQVARPASGEAHDDGERAMVLVKSNIECVREGLTFRIESQAQGGGAGARVRWLETRVPIGADAIEDPDRMVEAEALPEAAAFLRTLLEGAGGSMPAGQVIERAMESAISLTTLRRAKKMAGVLARRASVGGASRPWVWELDDHAPAGGDGHLTATEDAR